MTSTDKNRHLYLLNRNILFLTVVIYIIALILIWFDNLQTIKTSLEHSNSMLSQSVRSTLKSHELILRGLGQELITKGALQTPEKGRELIERMKKIDPGMVGFGLARSDGQLVLISGIQAKQALPNLAVNESTRDSFNEVINNKGIRTGRPYYFKALEHWVVPIRVPIFDQQANIKALMTAGYKIENASTSWNNIDMLPSTWAVLVRNDGYLIYSQPLLPATTESALQNTYSKPISQINRDILGKLNKQPAFIKVETPRTPNSTSHYLSYRYIPELNLHVGLLIAVNAVINSWLENIIIPTTLFLIFFFGGYWALRHSSTKQEHADKEISQLSAWQGAILDGADYGIISTDTNGTIVNFNTAAQRMLGYKAEEVVGKTTPEIFHLASEIKQRATQLSQETGEKVPADFHALVLKAIKDGVEEQEYTYIRKDGSAFPVFLSITPIYADTDEIIGFLGISANLSEKVTMQKNLQQSELRYQALFESASDAIFLMLDDQFVDCNPATLTMFGCKKEDIIGTTPQRYSPQFQPDGSLSSKKALQKITAAFNGQPQTFEWQHIKHNGQPFDAEVSLNVVDLYGQNHLLATVRDITERKHFEEELAFQAHHDSLTGLPNRMILHELFQQYAEQADANGSTLALLLIDLDGFKDVNDTLGHHAGDEVLLQIGPRMQSVSNSENMLISRLGGDEFAVLVNIEDNQDVQTIAEQFIEVLRQPFQTSSLKVRVGASLGIAYYPKHGRDSHEILRAADVAMYQAKKISTGIKYYDQQSDLHSTQRLKLASELTQAIKDQQMILHYQPKIDLSTGQTVSFEALVRWQHPAHGLLFPDAFIDLIEMSDVIQVFTQSIIELAVKEKKKLADMGFNQSVAVNLSTRNLTDRNCFDSLMAALSAEDLAADQVEIELTESALMHDPETTISILDLFHQQGINIAIDDFGTGYSSLSYLRKLPVSALKIDRSFVMNLIEDTQNSAIVRSTIALAHSLDLKVIAEGVENRETQLMLQAMQCDLAQGFGICRPKPFDQLLEWLKQSSNVSA